MLKNKLTHFLKGLLKRKLPALFLFAVIAVFTACQDVTGPAGDAAAGIFGLNAAASSVKVGQNVIMNQNDLADIELEPTGDYVLGASFSVTNWVPICGPYTGIDPFTGTLDGAGYTITVESFDGTALSSSDYIGIFAQSDTGASFTNLTVNLAAGIVETNSQYVGGLVGQAAGTRFNGITVTGTFDLASTTGEGIDFYAGGVAGSAEPNSNFNNITIEGCLNVLYASADTTLEHPIVKAGGVAGSIVGGNLDTVVVNSQITVKADMPYNPNYDVTPLVDNWLAVGGAAGYAEGLALRNVTIDTSTAVDAVSQHTQVYVGGVLGRGLSVNITGNVSDAVITGNGPGYNTSAGGIAGYIQQSTVTDSSASGAVTLGAVWETGSYDYWQIYAGGLVGYSGGTLNGNSSIIHSHATGAVSATAPYPYAGGLVGYNYGFNDFSGSPAEYAKFLESGGVTVTHYGSYITRSYAKGDVTAASTPGSNGIPYAGGLVGYSSIPPSDKRTYNIEDCYARGNVTVTTDSKYGWAGGILGANAQGSSVRRTYATGTVRVCVGNNEIPYPQPNLNPGAVGGGIVGMNYYIDDTSELAPLVTLSVGLNTLISGYSSDSDVAPYLLHRVAGDLGVSVEGILVNNFGDDEMSILPIWNPDIAPNGLDGDNCALQPPQSFYTASPLIWDFTTIWDMGTDGYPILR